MNYLVVAFSHKSCAIETREKLALDTQDKKSSLLKEMIKYDFINEVIALSTCNRVEVVVSTNNV